MIAIGLPNGWEWIIILVVILLLFGHRLPGMARSLGSGITEFKRGLKDGSGKDSGSSATPPAQKPESPGSPSSPASNDGPAR